jgi:hypothetical protein
MNEVHTDRKYLNPPLTYLDFGPGCDLIQINFVYLELGQC